MSQQSTSLFQRAQPLLQVPRQICGKAKKMTLQAYQTNVAKVQKTQQQLIVFKKHFIKYAKDISWETVNELFHIFEVIARVEGGRLDVVEDKKLIDRFQMIYTNLIRVYVREPYVFGKNQALNVYDNGSKYLAKKGLPLYIHVKAVLLVSQEMLKQFMENRMNAMKMSYETHKDSVVMFFSGNFNEDALKEKLANGIDGFKKFTVNIVNKGLQVKVDKQSLIQNYDRFANEFINKVNEIKEKSQENIGEVKKKSRDLYQEVILRIKAKQLQIKTEMKCIQDRPLRLVDQQIFQ